MIIITIYGSTYYYTLCVELAAFKQDIITAKKVSLLCGVHHSVIMANFILSETHRPIIVIILIIYSVYLLKDLVKL